MRKKIKDFFSKDLGLIFVAVLLALFLWVYTGIRAVENQYKTEQSSGHVISAEDNKKPEYSGFVR